MNGTTMNTTAAASRDSMTCPARYSEKASGKGLHILIVEDHSMSRLCLENLLQKCGHEVRSFGSAEEGLKLLGTDHFDVLLADFRLPGMDGLDLIQQAKAVRPSLRTLLMTGETGWEVYERAHGQGVDGLVKKPIELDELLAFLDRIGRTIHEDMRKAEKYRAEPSCPDNK